MTQTSKIAGGLIIAWIVFITTRGELPAYLSMLGIGTCSGSNCCSVGPTTTTTTTTTTNPPTNPPPTNPPQDTTQTQQV